MASMAVLTDTPFSNRPEDSVRMPRARLVTRVAARSNTAHSNIMVWVFSVISLSSPPMMPATQEGFFASQITS